MQTQVDLLVAIYALDAQLSSNRRLLELELIAKPPQRGASGLIVYYSSGSVLNGEWTATVLWRTMVSVSD